MEKTSRVLGIIVSVIIAFIAITSSTTAYGNPAAVPTDEKLNGSAIKANNTEDDEEDDEPRFSIETFVTIFVTLMIVVTNCAILIVAAWTEAFQNFNIIFIYSLTVADLFIGLFITPYSIFLSVYRRWVFSNELFCSVEAYVFACLVSARLYSLTWQNVDHYVAVRKPERYNVMMSCTRSFCWICFSWVVAVSFCGPPLFSFTSAIFNQATYLCQVDTSIQIAYLLTSLVLVCAPAIIALIITTGYLFTKSFHKRISFYEKVFVELSTRPHNYRITCVQGGVFALMWFPFVVITLAKAGEMTVEPKLEFYACWLGLSSSFSQFVTLMVMSTDFRDTVIELMAFPNWWPFCKYRMVEEEDMQVNIIKMPQDKNKKGIKGRQC